MTQSPFSVAMPAYNASEFLAATLDSIINQEMPPVEIVVVDDGSTDSTPQILESYSDKVRSIRIQNSGPGHARKVAVEACTSQWIALCDSDDLWLPEHLSRFHHAINRHPDINILISNFSSFGETATGSTPHFQTARKEWFDCYGEEIAEDQWLLSRPYEAFLEFNPAYPSGMAFTKDIYEQSGGIIEKYSRWKAEDSEFTRRLVAAPDARVWLDNRVGWFYRRHGQNFSETQWRNVEARAVILEEHIRKGVVPESCAVAANDVAERTRAKAFDIAYWTGFYREAIVIYNKVPQRQKSVMRKARRIMCSLKSLKV